MLLALVAACSSPAASDRSPTLASTAAPGPAATPGPAAPRGFSVAVLPDPDRWPGPRVRHARAVLLIAPRLSAGDDHAAPKPADRRFVPIVCSIDGGLQTGVRCGEIMPPRAKIRIPAGELAVQRSTTTFHDDAGGHDYPAPYGPACCMYNTCIGRTVPYAPAPAAAPSLGERTLLAVWPPDADLALEVAGDGVTGGAAADLPPHAPDELVLQAFARGTRRYATVGTPYGGRISWNLGAGWTTARSGPPGPRGSVILATTDVNHDGHLELIGYQLWANDHGIDVLGDADTSPLYSYSCGNI